MHLISTLLLSASVFAAERGPVYRQPLPKQICYPVARLDASTGDCSGNKAFLKRMQECWANVKQVHKQVEAEYRKVIAGNKGGAQNLDFQASKRNQEEAVAAHDFMLKYTQQALDELDKYFDFVVQPDHATTDQEVLAEPCYRDAVLPMDAIAEQMEDKIDEMKESKAMEHLMGKVSGAREDNTGSLSQQAGGGKGQGSGAAAAPKGAPPAKPSTITGVEQERKKREKKP